MGKQACRVPLSLIFIFLKLACSVPWMPCNFTEKCECELYQDTMMTVNCLNVSLFPDFSTAISTSISWINIEGNFIYIPPNAFYNFQKINYGINLRYVCSEDKCRSDNSLVVNEAAFNFSFKNPISLSFYSFSMVGNTTIPTKALQSASFSYLYFEKADFSFLTHGEFIGITAYMVQMVNCPNLVDVDFTGLNFTKNSFAADFSKNNQIISIPTAVGLSGVTAVSLSQTNLQAIPNYAIACAPNVPTNCSTISKIREIDLSSNLLIDEQFGEKAFSNMPNLTVVSLHNNSLTNISHVANIILTPISSTLKYLDLSSNSFSSIPSNAFFGFTSLTSLNLNNNPITNISIGAFNGTSSFKALILENMKSLTTVDLLITYGMENVTTLSLAYGGLETIELLNALNMPETLNLVNVANNNISTIDHSIGEWLQNCAISDCKLDVSQNTNFNCTNDISWMADYVCTKQINTAGASCANAQQQDLNDFLKQFGNCSTSL